MVEHRKARRKANKKNLLEHKCIVCGNIFERIKYRAGRFCGRSCASKYYIKNGIYDKWRLRINEKSGFYKKCHICEKEIYLPPRYRKKENLIKVCSLECEKAHFHTMFTGSGNPMFGKQLSHEQKEKQN
jgi:hypothetical protein